MFKDNNKRQNILRSETILTANHVPEELVSRGDEIEQIVRAVQPLTRRDQPENLFVYGPAGAGKSTCVKHVFDRLSKETRVKTVSINCWQYNTRSSLLTELLIQLGYPAPRKGKPVDELLSKLKEWLEKNRGVAVALDEFDQLDDNTQVVYDLQLLNQETENNIAVVMISNRPPESVQLDPRCQSRLNFQTLEFQPYNAPQLEKILEKRVEQAFRPGAVPDEVIERIAGKVAEENGDCREALNILLEAGRNVDREDDSQIRADTLEEIL